MTSPRGLRWDRGTLVLDGFPEDEVPAGFSPDPRIGKPRAEAIHYHAVALDLHKRRIPYTDEAKGYSALDAHPKFGKEPRDYQAEAVAAWHAAGRRGLVVLPTGSGKTFVAELAIANANRTTMVVAPTVDLVGQWYDRLSATFGIDVGILGGGIHTYGAITVATYDSAWMHVETWGNRFGLLIFDEVHHLPGASYGLAARCSIAPFRLGLTATLERADMGHHEAYELVGPVCYRKEITDLAGEFLAEYRTELVRVHLTDDEMERYVECTEFYRSFRNSRGIGGGRGGWSMFLREAARSTEGREALSRWRESRRILQGSVSKFAALEQILRRHANGRVIVFTNDNQTVYHLSKTLLIPAITHQTDIKERRALLTAFEDGSLPVLVTSRVLNEGVDLPGADVAVVLSGTGTVREHVQRLGRILRRKEGKQAVLYELVAADTTEESTSRRRRQHAAYGGIEG